MRYTTGIRLTKDQIKYDGLMLVRHQVIQAVSSNYLHENCGPNATSVDGYVDTLRSIMRNCSISVDDARGALEDINGPYLNEVLEAINRIEKEEGE